MKESEVKELLRQLEDERATHQMEISRLDPAIEALETLTKKVEVKTYSAVWTHPDGGKIEFIDDKRKRNMGRPRKHSGIAAVTGKKTKKYKIKFGKVIGDWMKIRGETSPGWNWTREDINGFLIKEYGSKLVAKNKKRISVALINLVQNGVLKHKKGKTRAENTYSLV